VKEFEITQKETLLVAKNFENYKADVSLLKEINRLFGFRFRPPTPEGAWLYTRRRMERRTYDFGDARIVGNEEVGYSLFLGELRVARIVLAGSELVIAPDYEAVAVKERPIVEQALKDLRNIYDTLLNKITTEKISEITSRVFSFLGAVPLRPRRGDFYLLRDLKKLRTFIELVEGANENRELNPHSFIVTKIDRTTVDVLRTSLFEKIAMLENRLANKDAKASTYRSVISDANDLLVSLQNLGSYLLEETEINACIKRINAVIKKAKKLEQRSRGVYRRKVW